MKQVTAAATVTLTVEVKGLGTWGEALTVEQVRKQAIEAARCRLNKLGGEHQFKIVGEPRVSAITMEDL